MSTRPTLAAAVLVGAGVLAGPVVVDKPVRRLEAVQQTPTFRAAVDLIAVDVLVTRSNGEPVADLTPADFDVRIDGRPRRVVSAQFMRAESSGDIRQGGTGPVATNDGIVGSVPGRTFILAFDAASVRAGDSLPMRQAASTFITKLPANDLIGVVALPNGVRLSPTADRAPVRDALSRVVGHRRALVTSFRLSLVEVIEITSQAGSIRARTTPRGRGGDALASPANETLRSVQRRECEADPECVNLLLADAESLAQQMESDAARSLAGLSSLLTLLQEYEGRKTVIVLSGGMPSSDRAGGRPDLGDSTSALGEQAARANAIVYAVHVDRTFRDAVSAQSRVGVQETSGARERSIHSKLLADFAYPSGGAVLTSVADDGEVALDRVLLETSGYYLLGVEPTGVDRDGRARRLEVRVTPQGTTVRSRRWVIVTRPGQ